MTRRFTDRDGVEWTIEWREAETVGDKIAGGPDSLPSGLQFAS